MKKSSGRRSHPAHIGSDLRHSEVHPSMFGQDDTSDMIREAFMNRKDPAKVRELLDNASLKLKMFRKSDKLANRKHDTFRNIPRSSGDSGRSSLLSNKSPGSPRKCEGSVGVKSKLTSPNDSDCSRDSGVMNKKNNIIENAKNNLGISPSSYSSTKKL